MYNCTVFSKKEAGKLFSKISVDPISGCWNWIGKLDNGYGRITFRGKRRGVHRLMFLWKNGELPEWRDKNSKEIDHICNNRACCNPEHLRLVSCKENVLRGKGPTAINSQKTRCIHGHESLYVVGNRRRCRECRRIFDASEKRKKWRDSWFEKQKSKATVSVRAV